MPSPAAPENLERPMMKNRLLAGGTTLFHGYGRIACALAFAFAGALPEAYAGAHTTSSNGEIKPGLIYHNYCSVCHGDKQGSLNPPPRDFTSPAAATQLTREYMITIVKNGKPGTAMVGWHSQLNDKEIEAVVDYVRGTFMPAHVTNDSNRGRIVYSDKGDGKSRAQFSLNPPPRDFTAPAAKAELSRERMIKSVTYGRPDTAMAGFKTQLSNDDIEAVVDYIRSGIMGINGMEGASGTSHGKRYGLTNNVAVAATQPHMPMAPAMKPATVDMKAPLPNGLKGDATKGAAFYMSNCATCHGTTGDGRGPRAYFINPKPRNFLHPASREEFNRVALFNAISNGKLGTEMPAWDKVLSSQEIADVAEFVFQRFIRGTGGEGKTAKK